MFTVTHSFAAQLAMILGPILTLIFLVMNRKRIEAAAFFCFAMAMLYLPEGIKFDLAGIPPLDKEQAVLIVIMAFALWRLRKKIRRARPGRGLDWFVTISMIGGLGTAATNEDWLSYGSWITTHIRGLTMHDSVSLAVRDLVGFGLPFVVGRALFRTTRHLEILLRILATSGLVYTAFCLIEIRLSPQLHTWIYGYPQHSDFAQTIRWGGFRPMVFMPHGLAVAMFMCAATMSCAVLGRINAKVTPFRVSARAVTWYLFLILLALKSTGAIIYGMLFVPIMTKVKPRNIVRVAIAVALFVTIYPSLRATRVFPAQQFVELSRSVFGVHRAQSLEFRFSNEELLLDKAFTRPYFGWGGEGRGRVYDEEMGKEVTIADGWWIILFSSRGAIGMVCNFAVLLVPIFAMAKRIRKIRDPREAKLIAALTLILAAYTLDMVPNAAFSLMPYVLSGALWSISREMVRGTASLPVCMVSSVPKRSGSLCSAQR